MHFKTPRKITSAAKGEPCTLNIPGHCNYNSETTCFCHHDDGGGGSNRLTGPLSGGFGCSGCHDCIDSRAPTAFTQDDLEFFKRRSMMRTVNRLIVLGLVKVDGLET